jgi:hypothetical protein
MKSGNDNELLELHNAKARTLVSLGYVRKEWPARRETPKTSPSTGYRVPLSAVVDVIITAYGLSVVSFETLPGLSFHVVA